MIFNVVFYRYIEYGQKLLLRHLEMGWGENREYPANGATNPLKSVERDLFSPVCSLLYYTADVVTNPLKSLGKRHIVPSLFCLTYCYYYTIG